MPEDFDQVAALAAKDRERGYRGGYTAVTDALRELRPPAPVFEVRFETPSGGPTAARAMTVRQSESPVLSVDYKSPAV